MEGTATTTTSWRLRGLAVRDEEPEAEGVGDPPPVGKDKDGEALASFRRAAEVHRQARAYAREHLLKPGAKLVDVCEGIEDKARELLLAGGGSSWRDAGLAFPCGASVNHVAAHWTPNPRTDDDRVLRHGDVVSIDFGTQVHGKIIDSAFTVAFDDRYDPLLEATKEATNTAIEHAGVDARIPEISGLIKETIESFEIELGGTTLPIRPVANLSGHSIEPYNLHGRRRVPPVPNTGWLGGGCGGSWWFGNGNDTMEEGEVYAIETFATTGRGWVVSGPHCSHYMKRRGATARIPAHEGPRVLLEHIEKTFGTLAFCPRWLEEDRGTNNTNYVGALRMLCDEGIVDAYPAVHDVPGSYVAQYEHTLILRPNGGKEVLSRGDDY